MAGDPVLSEVSKGGHEGQHFVSENPEVYSLAEGETSYIHLTSVFSTGWAGSSTLSSVAVLLRNKTFFMDICAAHHSGRTVPSFGQDGGASA